MLEEEEEYNSLQSFLNDDSFVDWVLYNKNKKNWENFLLENPHKEALILEARKIISEIITHESVPSFQLDQRKVWEKISGKIFTENESTTKLPIVKTAYFKWVAIFIVFLGMGIIFYISKPEEKLTYKALVRSIENKTVMIERINNSDSKMKIILEDGSIVTLAKGSRISFPAHFHINKRTVILSGEAFFEIQKNPSKPFYVYANEVVTKVLGTSFSIKAYDYEKKVIVKVSTGKVSVFNQTEINIDEPESNAIILLPNQQAIYNRPTEGLTKQLVELPKPLIETNIEKLPIQFDEVGVNMVLEKLEKIYGVKLIYNEDDLSKCIITTKLKNGSLYDQLDIICNVIGGSYKEVDAQIIIESKGCQ